MSRKKHKQDNKKESLILTTAIINLVIALIGLIKMLIS